MTREAINEVRAKCRLRWVAERSLWRTWRTANHDRQGHYDRALLSHELRCAESARKRMRAAAAARLSTAARAIRAEKVVRSGAWLGELEVARRMLRELEEDANGSRAAQSQRWSMIEGVLNKAIYKERGHSPNIQLSGGTPAPTQVRP